MKSPTTIMPPGRSAAHYVRRTAHLTINDLRDLFTSYHFDQADRMESILQDLPVLTRSNWELLVFAWQLFPVFTGVQWLTDFYPQGKTSIESKYNLPGKWAWAVMECAGPIALLYCMFTIPQHEGLPALPWGNWTVAGLYVIHYIYRALLAPLLLNPSMSPIHPLVFLSAVLFNIVNGLSIGGWAAGYGPNTVEDWAGRVYVIEVGLVIWGWALLANFFHDDDLREIRRAAMRRQKQQAEKDGKPMEGVSKFYMLPKNGLFHYVTHAHYLCEWIEWFGFYVVAGWDCVPARAFLINEITTMTPRALSGHRWYVKEFGKERVGKRKAVIPGIL